MQIPVALPEPGRYPFDAVGFGLNSLDWLAIVDAYPEKNTKQRLRGFTRAPGGQAATAMVACARLGWRARYIGRFGDDAHGATVRDALRREGVDVAACEVPPGSSNQFALIVVDERSGDRTILWDRDPALNLAADDVPADAVRSGRVLLVDCHQTVAATRAARLARAAGCPVVIDVEKVRPGIAELLEQVDVIIAAEDLPSGLTGAADVGEALKTMADEFPAPVVCVTLGREGSLARCGGREVRTPGFDVPAVDTTGAGDAFRGGFIAGWLAGGVQASLEEVLVYANAVAALKCRALGAQAGIPGRDEARALARTRF